MYGDALTELERDVIATMLRHEHPVARLLRAQLDVCHIKSRNLSGVGFFTDIVVPQVLAVSGLDSMHLNDAVLETDTLEHGAGFVLFIRNGMLEMLEGFTYDEPWPDKIGNYSVGPAETLTPEDLRALQFAERRD
jgi:hypothetical protein